ncbi:MAG TPA: cytochrome c biogenesis protein ResB [Pyrinomonadaceae bacterium]|nr:cytochrome c biogenesis protein ResB [Pyrinomonadaceae bacterium]
MSAAEETIKAQEISKGKGVPLFNRALDQLSSVRLGVVLLCVLVVLAMIGMLIIQQNVQGFDAYYAGLTPAEKLVFGYLGLFDIYHSWYFNLALLVLSLNIVLASIERFPSAWSYVASPKLTATRDWLLNQKVHTTVSIEAEDESGVAEKVKKAFADNGLSARTATSSSTSYVIDENGKKDFTKTLTTTNLFVFGESCKWNRLGAYAVHVGLLILFLGHFVALQTGFDADVRMIPGDKTDQIQMIQFDLDKKEKFGVQLPFSLTCTDIQQKLIDPRGSIDVTNTLDWRTQIKVDDPEYGTTVADISMNRPYTYRGYRFFQAQTIPIGNARNITLKLTPQPGGEPVTLTIPRLGSASLPDGTKVEYEEFLPDFTFNDEGKPDTRTGEYNNPVAVLGVTQPGGPRMRVFAFGGNVPDNIPVAAPKAGYKWRLAEFEKSPFAHVLSIKYDPYNAAFIAWYFGGFSLLAALGFVFFFSHKRAWAMIEDAGSGLYNVTLAGDANRNNLAFEEKFKNIAARITGETRTEEPE